MSHPVQRYQKFTENCRCGGVAICGLGDGSGGLRHPIAYLVLPDRHSRPFARRLQGKVTDDQSPDHRCENLTSLYSSFGVILDWKTPLW